MFVSKDESLGGVSVPAGSGTTRAFFGGAGATNAVPLVVSPGSSRRASVSPVPSEISPLHSGISSVGGALPALSSPQGPRQRFLVWPSLYMPGGPGYRVGQCWDSWTMKEQSKQSLTGAQAGRLLPIAWTASPGLRSICVWRHGRWERVPSKSNLGDPPSRSAPAGLAHAMLHHPQVRFASQCSWKAETWHS